jgi:hypothetical protein
MKALDLLQPSYTWLTQQNVLLCKHCRLGGRQDRSVGTNKLNVLQTLHQDMLFRLSVNHAPHAT